MIVAGTGHRPNKLGDEYFLNGPITGLIARRTMSELEKLGATTVITGMAQGYDQILACCAIKLNIGLLAYVPHDDQQKLWPTKSKELYQMLIDQADEVRVISPGPYAAWKMQKRNEAMVNDCDVLMSVWDGSEGGTANCIKYARKIKRKMVNLWGDMPAWEIHH